MVMELIRAARQKTGLFHCPKSKIRRYCAGLLPIFRLTCELNPTSYFYIRSYYPIEAVLCQVGQ